MGESAPAGQRTLLAAWTVVAHADWRSAGPTLAVVGFVALLMVVTPRLHRAIPESLAAVVADGPVSALGCMSPPSANCPHTC